MPGPKTILLVEDDDDVRGLFKTILTKKGYEVLEAGDGASALELASRHSGPIDLLLANGALPALSGYDVRQQLRAARPEMNVLYPATSTAKRCGAPKTRPGRTSSANPSPWLR